MQKKIIAIVVIVLATLLLAQLFAYIFQLATASPQVAQPAAPLPASISDDQSASLGGQIYEKSQNPLQEKLPDTNPVKNANPIEGAYTNPF